MPKFVNLGMSGCGKFCVIDHLYILVIRITYVKSLPNDNAKVDSINKRLDMIIGILLNQVKFQESTAKEKILHLDSLKFDNTEIARILNTTESFVAKEKSLAKKGKKKND